MHYVRKTYSFRNNFFQVKIKKIKSESWSYFGTFFTLLMKSLLLSFMTIIWLI